MRTTHQTLEDCQKRAVEDFKHLVIYYCVTRPQYNNTFKENGKFSLELFLKWLEFLSTWDKRPASEKRQHAHLYAKRSAEWNYKFGIDKELVNQVLGTHKINGKVVRINITDILNSINKNPDNPLIKVINNGRKFVFENGKHKKDSDGKSIVKCYWLKKYLIANNKYWIMLLKNPKYNDITKFGSKRLQRIIFKWNETHIEQKTEEQKPKTEERKEVVKLNATVKPKTTVNLAQECGRMFSAGRIDEFALKTLLSGANLGFVSDDGIAKLRERKVEVTDDEYKDFAIRMFNTYYREDQKDTIFQTIIWQMYEKYADIRELL